MMRIGYCDTNEGERPPDEWLLRPEHWCGIGGRQKMSDAKPPSRPMYHCHKNHAPVVRQT